MRSAILIFPGSNCDRDMMVAVEQITGRRPALVWHKESQLDPVDIVIIPGGFSFGDYLRCGALAARAPAMEAVIDHASRGGAVLGVCNGFQILLETGLLPGTLVRNSGLKLSAAKPVWRYRKPLKPRCYPIWQQGQNLSFRLPIMREIILQMTRCWTVWNRAARSLCAMWKMTLPERLTRTGLPAILPGFYLPMGVLWG